MGDRWHVGRLWSGHELEDTCPCAKAPCGLVVSGETDPSCDQHGTVPRTLRQGHLEQECPAVGPEGSGQ